MRTQFSFYVSELLKFARKPVVGTALLLLCAPVMRSQSFGTISSSMTYARSSHTSTLLDNGTVLLTGGQSWSGSSCCSWPAVAEIYTPSATGGGFSTTGTLNVARSFHTATLLQSGQVLIVGGQNANGALSSAEVYSGSAFTPTGSLNTARWWHTATLLNDGTVLIAGGTNSGNNPSSSAEIYNPTTGMFTTIGNMNVARTAHTATLLSNGQVLIAGGYNNGPLASAEIYDPLARTFTLTGSMSTARWEHTATLLLDGTVLIAGGGNSGSNLDSATSTSEIYTLPSGANPALGAFTSSGPLQNARMSGSVSQLPDGTVLFAGGFNSSSSGDLSSAERYTAASSTVSGSFALTGNLNTARDHQTSTLLSNGSVLITGGENEYSTFSSAELYSYPTSSGTVSPKYIVLAVIYAPPGSGSTVNYQESTMVGTSTSSSKTNQTTNSVSASINLGFGFFGLGADNTYTATASYTQEADTSSSYTVNKTTALQDLYPGPSSAAVGVDHDYDAVQVWLNPVANLSIPSTTSPVLWNGFSYDSNDYLSRDMDVVSLPVYCLKNPYSTLLGNLCAGL